MQAYIQWVNSQLRKRPGSRVVDDLQNDMKDGVALLQLIEVVGNEKMGIIESPISISDMSSNVTNVLKFMAERKVKMHQINCKEIVEGNKRAIMRVILALAAHFKPGSVRHSHNDNSFGKLERASSTMSLAAEAAMALADASQIASSAGSSLHYKYKQRPDFDRELSQSNNSLHQLSTAEIVHSRSSSSASSTSQKSTSTLPRMKHKKHHGSSSPSQNSPRYTTSDVDAHALHESSPNRHHAIRKYLSDDTARHTLPRKMKISASKSDGGSARSSRPSSANSNASVDDHTLAEEHNNMIYDVKALSECLIDLQNMLLQGDEADVNENYSFSHDILLDASSAQDQVIILQARLDQARKDYQNLKNASLALKEDTVKLQGEKVGLQSRLKQLEQASIALRTDHLRQQLACDSARSAKESAQRTIDEREKQIANLHEELATRDHVIEEQRREIQHLKETIAGRENTEADRDAQLSVKESLDSSLRQQIEDLSGRLEQLSDSETQITSNIDRYNKRLARMEDLMARSAHPKELTKEHDKAYNTLENLRSSFGKHDPRQHALDSISQSISAIVEKASTLTPKNELKPPDKRSSKTRLAPKEKLKQSDVPSSSDSKSNFLNGSVDGLGSTKSQKRTKVLYFVNQSVTPYLAFINNSLGEITLHDFKMLLDRSGSYRYFFKSVDPDFGSVREEIISDHDILPGWDGKIVCWIEDDKELGPEYRNPVRGTPKNSHKSYVVERDAV